MQLDIKHIDFIQFSDISHFGFARFVWNQVHASLVLDSNDFWVHQTIQY